jgi:plasmid maintenance system antidote protein VapI
MWLTIRIITEGFVFMRMFDPPHPGTVLKDYLGNISVTAAAAALGRFGTSPELWIGMQSNYDPWQASNEGHKKLKPLLVG